MFYAESISNDCAEPDPCTRLFAKASWYNSISCWWSHLLYQISILHLGPERSSNNGSCLRSTSTLLPFPSHPPSTSNLIKDILIAISPTTSLSRVSETPFRLSRGVEMSTLMIPIQAKRIDIGNFRRILTAVFGVEPKAAATCDPCSCWGTIVIAFAVVVVCCDDELVGEGGGDYGC